MNKPIQTASPEKQAILHICKREMLRPLRDQILRLSGYTVDSTCDLAEAMSLFGSHSYALVLIDVEGEFDVPEAEHLCAEIKKAKRSHLVAFVCNWRVAALTDCPDDIVRTEFDPAAFVAGVKEALARHRPTIAQPPAPAGPRRNPAKP